LPKEFLKQGESYGVKNLRFRTTRSDLEYQVSEGSQLKTKLTMRGSFKQISVRDASGSKLGTATAQGNKATITFNATNGKAYTVSVTT
jgi:hypothetical protein